jgi:hypothetical protein
LDRLAAAAGCKITDIQVVPGNHDINRDGMCRSSEMMLAEIAEKGEPRLDYFLELEKDREVFYGRFEDYREFAEGYNCPLDRDGGTAGERAIEIAHGRTLRFIGLNSALCCAKKDEKGKLLLGARQRTLPRKAGEELVVICHHPLPWLRDSEEARQYVRSRARVFISGHEICNVAAHDDAVDPPIRQLANQQNNIVEQTLAHVFVCKNNAAFFLPKMNVRQMEKGCCHPTFRSTGGDSRGAVSGIVNGLCQFLMRQDPVAWLARRERESASGPLIE